MLVSIQQCTRKVIKHCSEPKTLDFHIRTHLKPVINASTYLSYRCTWGSRAKEYQKWDKRQFDTDSEIDYTEAADVLR